jgi:hypothetical protein
VNSGEGKTRCEVKISNGKDVTEQDILRHASEKPNEPLHIIVQIMERAGYRWNNKTQTYSNRPIDKWICERARGCARKRCKHIAPHERTGECSGGVCVKDGEYAECQLTGAKQ